MLLLAVVVLAVVASVVAEDDSEEEKNEHPGKDIMGRRCNAGSMHCECMKAEDVLGRSTCGVMSSCRADPRDGKQRCLPDASVSQK